MAAIEVIVLFHSLKAFSSSLPFTSDFSFTAENFHLRLPPSKKKRIKR
jgi:hypothetical protein